MIIEWSDSCENLWAHEFWMVRFMYKWYKPWVCIDLDLLKKTVYDSSCFATLNRFFACRIVRQEIAEFLAATLLMIHVQHTLIHYSSSITHYYVIVTYYYTLYYYTQAVIKSFLHIIAFAIITYFKIFIITYYYIIITTWWRHYSNIITSLLYFYCILLRFLSLHCNYIITTYYYIDYYYVLLQIHYYVLIRY